MHPASEYATGEVMYEGAATRIIRGVRLRDGRPMIMKVLRAAFPSARDVARLQHEYELLRRLALPGVAAAEALVRSDAGLALVMADGGGRSLAELLAEGLTLRDALQIAADVADTLAEVHQRDVVHRDLKPSNIIVRREPREVTIIDFGSALLLPRDGGAPARAGAIEGTLAYLAPEQTGRMNRSVDHRADLYALGVTLYEALTGRLPFAAHDDLELIHAHIAREPVPPHLAAPGVPAAVSAIVLKLMAKTPEERYQSADGLRADLQECLRQLDEQGAVGALTPGLRDRSARFQLPQRLYGREAERAALLEAFGRAAAGRAELVLVSGPAGSGKSALVQELQAPVGAQRGAFIAGKFDQFKRDIPYSGFIQAFRELAGQILGGSDRAVAEWRRRLAEALGPNGQIIAELLPDMALVLGPLPPLPPLPPGEAQNRFNLVLQNFVGALARPEHPLALVLDDLQWADNASIQLLQVLLGGGERALLVVASFRDGADEGGELLGGRLAPALAALPEAGRITLRPLDAGDMRRLVADAFGRAPEEAADLADIALAKTAGNPFFVREFLKALYDDGLLRFERRAGRWEWDAGQIRRRDITDNVVELMSARIERLPEPARRLLTLAAAVGSSFELATLAQAAGRPQAAVAEELGPALREGLLLPQSDDEQLLRAGGAIAAAALEHGLRVSYRFLHDRVQQAAYLRTPEPERPAVHLAIGRVLLAALGDPAAADSDALFDAANHMGQAAAPADEAERGALARLNLAAGRRARASLAYQPAQRYLAAALALLPADRWAADYALAAAVVTELAECAYLVRDFDTAERLFAEALANVRTPLEQAALHNQRVVLISNSGRFAEAIAPALEGLRLLGFELPAAPTQAEVAAEIGLEHQLRAGRPVLSLLELPPLADPALRTALGLMMSLLPCAFVTGQAALWALTDMRMITLTYRHGSSPAAAVAYGGYGIILAGTLGDYQAAEAFGRLAAELVAPLRHPAFDSKIFFIRGVFLNHWRGHIRESLPLLARSLRDSLDGGDFLYAGYNQQTLHNYLALSGAGLDEVEAELVRTEALARQLGFEDVRLSVVLTRQWIRCLRGETAAPDSFTDGGCDDGELLGAFLGNRYLVQLQWYLIFKAQVRYLAGVYDHDDLAATWGRLPPIYQGAPQDPERQFLQALALAAGHDARDAERQAQDRAALAAYRDCFAVWAEHSPQNYGFRHALIAAELARLEGDELAAVGWYDRALAAAQEHGFAQYAGLAGEVAGRFHLAAGRVRVAHAYLADAREAYLAWGATAVVRRLDERYGQLLHAAPQRLGSRTTRRITTESEGGGLSLDLGTVFKAANSIAGEIVLERLLERLLRIALENAGAQRGALIVNEDGALTIEAVGAVDDPQIAVLQSVPLAESREVSPGIVNYVARTGENVVLDDAAARGPFVGDEYVRSVRPRSVLCAPLMNQGRLAAVVYLENNLTSGAFTPERLAPLGLLAGQAAIAIENARLYRQIEAQNRTLEQRVAERTAELALAKATAEEARAAAEAASSAKSTFLANMSHELRTPLNAVLGFVQVLNRDATLSSRNREHLGIITRSGEHLLGLINDVLEMSKIEAGKVRLNEAPFDLRQLLQSTEEMFRLRAEGRQIALHWEVDEALPRHVVGDESKLRQVLINLLGNAVKFTRQGSVTLRAGLAAGGAEPQAPLVIEVEDTGEGIAPEQLAGLFQPFVQTDSGLRAREGTGLGLAITHQFVRLMGGSVTVRSELGAGTCFRLQLPLAPASAELARPESAERAVVRLAPGSGETRVLVVDDKDENRLLLLEWLSAVGFHVREARDGLEAVAEWERWRPHLVWMDVRMPRLDGYAAARRIKAAPGGERTVVIALTASVFEDRATIAASGCDDFVYKPVREAVVFQKMAEHLGVQFEYDETAPAPAAERAPVDPAAVAALPAEVRAALGEAAAELDPAMVAEAIERVRALDATLAGALEGLAAGFRFDAIEALTR